MILLSSLLFFAVIHLSPAVGTYTDNAYKTIETLQDKWYDANTGRWNNMWWETANILTTIAKFGSTNLDFKPTAENIVATTFEKIANPPGGQPNGSRWINDYYDDEGWWALAWIASYDLTGDRNYLDTAKFIFEDMTGGWTTPCRGLIWWDKHHTFISAISNELFVSVAAHLANRETDDALKQYYVDWAESTWHWFNKAGLVNDDNLINDGVDQSTCRNDGAITYTYNQGVILGGLAELSSAADNGMYIDEAKRIAHATADHLTNNGILTEPVRFLDQQAAQFKGAFVRGLADLLEKSPSQPLKKFLLHNADTAWERAIDGSGVVIPDWAGKDQGSPGATSHASGVDLFVAAAQVTNDQDA